MTRLDHVILGVRDLDVAAERLERRLGLGSYAGGKHPGWGTANRIVPLGGAYVELIAVVDAEEARSHPFGRTFADSLADGDRLSGWCLAVEDLESVAARLGLPIRRGARLLPGGDTLRWSMVGREEAMAEPFLPFFIRWEVPEDRHPGRVPVPHRAEPTGIAWVEVSGERRRLAEWLGGADVPVRAVEGPAAVRAAGIATSRGELVLR